MKYTLKEFQTEYPDDAACLERLMDVQYGGTEITCPGLRCRKRQIPPYAQAEGLSPAKSAAIISTPAPTPSFTRAGRL